MLGKEWDHFKLLPTIHETLDVTFYLVLHTTYYVSSKNEVQIFRYLPKGRPDLEIN